MITKRRIAWWAFWGFVVFFVVNNPLGAAATARHIGTGIGAAASGFSTFLGHVSTP